MQAAFILMLDTGDDTDLLGVAEDVKQLVDHQEGLIVIYCKPFQHPSITPPNPLGAPTPPLPPTGS